MSTRAYKIIKIHQENTSTFNLWHDEKLMEFLLKEEMIEPILSGILSISVETLEKVIKKAKKLEIDDETLKMLRKHVETAHNEKEFYIEYLVY